MKGGGARGGGVAGAAGNVQTYSAGAGAGAGSNYDRKSSSTDFGVGKTVSKTEVAPGKVENLQVALLVDNSVPAATMRQLRTVVATATGIDVGRGDQLQAAQVAFAKPPAPAKAGPVPVAMLAKLKYVAVGLGALLFLFFTSRQLKRREGETLAEPAWLTQIERPTRLSELESGRPTREMVLPEPEPDFHVQSLDHLADRQPERVAAQVKAWMSED